LNKKIRNVLALLAVVLCAGSVFAHVSSQIVVANVPFEFYVGDSQLPAGQYEVYPDGIGELSLVIRNVRTGATVFAPIAMRTGVVEMMKAELVFDKTQDRTYLSVVRPLWADGLQLNAVRTKHSHVVVKSS